MPNRKSKSAIFISAFLDNSKKGDQKRSAKKPIKDIKKNQFATLPKDFSPTIKFHTKTILDKKSKDDLIHYLESIIQKYIHLNVVISKPPLKKIFGRIAHSKNSLQNIPKEGLLELINDAQIKFRNIEILNFIEQQKNSKKNLEITKKPEVENQKTNINLNIKDIDNRNIRLSAVSKQLNTSIKVILEVLKNEGFIFENNPNAKIPISCVNLVIKKFRELTPLITNEEFVNDRYTEQPEIIDTEIQKDLDKVSDKFNLSSMPNNLPDIKEKIKEIDNSKYVKSIVLQQFIRSQYVKEYALIRANGICELCEKKAPFIDINNKPFLEVHHIIWLSKGGEDSIENVVGICPNCHRKIHNLNSKTDYEKLLNKRNKF